MGAQARVWGGQGAAQRALRESAVFEEKLLWPGGHPLSTRGPTVKDPDGHTSTLVFTRNAYPRSAQASPAAESKPWAAVYSCTTQHRASKVPRAFEKGNLASDQNKGGQVFLPVSILERREFGFPMFPVLCFRTRTQIQGHWAGGGLGASHADPESGRCTWSDHCPAWVTRNRGHPHTSS